VLETSTFVAELLEAFRRQEPGPDGRGARVTCARAIDRDESDFGLEVEFHALPSGDSRTDAIREVRAYMAGCGVNDAAGLAAFWAQELDEQTLGGGGATIMDTT